jgi:hypothetical protein
LDASGGSAFLNILHAVGFTAATFISVRHRSKEAEIEVIAITLKHLNIGRQFDQFLVEIGQIRTQEARTGRLKPTRATRLRARKGFVGEASNTSDDRRLHW